MYAAETSRRPSARLRLRALALFTAVALAGILLGVWLAFPAAPLTRNLLAGLARQGILIEPVGLRRGWPLAVEAASARVSFPALRGRPLEIDNLRISPSVSSFPGLTLTAKLWGGRVEADADDSLNTRVRLTGARLPAELLDIAPLQLAGRIAQLNFNGRLPLSGANQSRLELVLENLSLGGLRALGAGSDSLSLGTVRARVEGTGNRLNLTQLSGDGALRIAGSGTLWLGRTPATSRISLQLTLTPTPTLDAGIRDMLGLLGKAAADGSISLRLGGTLAAPKAG
ncbi:MAG: type II secretion system protein GspN [Deltaproteobacteria bacterium]|nr:MAG: type II secretion system protein GspN [Deltaproteobacteria bacterium]